MLVALGVFIKYLAIFSVLLVIGRIFWDFVKLCFPDRSSRAIKYVFEQVSWLRVPSLASLVDSRFLSNDYFRVLSLVVFNRLAIILFATFIYSLLNEKSFSILEHFRDVWVRWDANHYLLIAKDGYPREGSETVLLVFYPLYPMAVRLFSSVFSNYLVSSLFVSGVSLVAASIMLYKLVLLEFRERATALYSVKLLLIFPLSFFYFTPYTESLFLCLTISSFYCIRTYRWFWAGLLGGMAALTRNQGVILFAPMAYELVAYLLMCHRAKQMPRVPQIIFMVLCLLLIPLGTFTYLLVNKYISGDWFKFLYYQKTHWGQYAIFYADNVKNIYERAFIGSNYSQIVGIWMPGIVIFILCLVLVLAGAFMLPASYSIYAVVYLVISYSPNWLLSGPRYLAVVFPMYIVLAKLLEKRPAMARSLEVFFILFMALTIVAFMRGKVF